MYQNQRELKRVDNEFDVKFVLFLNKEDNANIRCEDRHDGFYSEDPNPLQEFLDGYRESRKNGYPYEDTNDPSQVELMDQFIDIVSQIYEGGIEYTAERMDIIIRAVEQFGL